MLEVSRRHALVGGVALAAVASEAPLAAPAAAAPSFPEIDPELRPFAEAVFKATGSIDAAKNPLPLLRAPRLAGSTRPPDQTLAPVTQVTLPGRAGGPPTPAYLVGAPTPGRLRGAVIYIHGGGFIAGSAAKDLERCQDIAARHDCLVLTPDYRLAPETTFPGSREDNYAALAYLNAKAAELGVDVNRIIVMGWSAGGGHAALLALAARDRGEFRLAAQVLIYPMLDDRTASTRRPPPTVGRVVWTPALNRLGWGAFLGVPAGSAKIPAGAAPARVSDLRGLPPAFIGVGGADLFVDEDIEYARRLIDAGVPTDLLVIPGAFHAFDAIASGTKPAQMFTAAWRRFLETHLKA